MVGGKMPLAWWCAFACFSGSVRWASAVSQAQCWTLGLGGDLSVDQIFKSLEETQTQV